MSVIQTKTTKFTFELKDRLGYAGYKRINVEVSRAMDIPVSHSPAAISVNEALLANVISQVAVPEVIISVTKPDGAKVYDRKNILACLEELEVDEGFELDSHAQKLYIAAADASRLVNAPDEDTVAQKKS